MLNAGASDDLSAKICDILGYQDRNTDHINTFCRKAIEESAQLDKRADLNLENRWTLNKLTGYTISSSFSGLLKDFYHVDVESSDLDGSDVEFLADIFPEVDLFYNDVFASVYLPFGDGVYEMVA